MASLKQLAAMAGANEDLDCQDYDVFVHGTTVDFANLLARHHGECLSAAGGAWKGQFFTVTDIETARVFAARTCAKQKGSKPALVGVALSPASMRYLQSNRYLISRPIPNPPKEVKGHPTEFVFTPGALPHLQRNGFFFLVP